MTSIDSAPHTLRHIQTVQTILALVQQEIDERAAMHDRSKLGPLEKPAFDRAILLSDLTYGSPEYEAARRALGGALDHHYAVNRHHPEHHPNGIRDMTLIDLIEMVCDWIAATERHADGDIRESLRVNARRFAIPEPLQGTLAHTIEAIEAKRRLS